MSSPQREGPRPVISQGFALDTPRTLEDGGRIRSVLKNSKGIADTQALKERSDFRFSALSNADFALQLSSGDDSPRMPVHRAKHVPLRVLPRVQAGENPQRQAAWSARSPPLPAMAHPSMQRQMWSPTKPRTATLRSPDSARLLRQYRAAQPGTRPQPPRRSPEQYWESGLGLLYAGQYKEATENLSAAVQVSGRSGCPPQLQADRACALDRGGKHQAALDSFSDLLLHSPTAMELYASRAKVRSPRSLLHTTRAACHAYHPLPAPPPDAPTRPRTQSVRMRSCLQVLEKLGQQDAAVRDWKAVASLSVDPALRRRANGALERSRPMTSDAVNPAAARPQTQPPGVDRRPREISTPIRTAHEYASQARPMTVQAPPAAAPLFR